jgi:hypothetical protein
MVQIITLSFVRYYDYFLLKIKDLVWLFIKDLVH